MTLYKAKNLILIVVIASVAGFLMIPMLFEGSKSDSPRSMPDVQREVDVENPLTETRPDLVAVYLKNALMRKKYVELEQFATHAYNNKRLTPGGRDYFSAIINNWFINPNVLNPGFKAAIEGWVAANPQSPYALLARGRYLYEEGWEIRGPGWPKDVPNDKWIPYQEKLRSAWDDLTRAQKINASLPYSYELASAVVGQIWGEGKLTTQHQLIDTAISQKVNDLYGVYESTLIYGYSPRWGGNAETMLNFARKVSASSPPKSLFPLLVAVAHRDIANLLVEARRQDYYAQQGVWNEVASAFNRVVADYPASPRWLVEYAEVAYDAGKMKLAADLLNRARKIDSEYPELYRAAGHMYMEPSTYNMAEKSYQRYSELRPSDHTPFSELAWMMIKQNKYQDAVAYADKGLAVNSKDCLLLTHRCLAKYHLNQYEPAMADCNRALQLDKQCKPAYAHKALIYRATGKEAEAKKEEQTYQWLNRQ